MTRTNAYSIFVVMLRAAGLWLVCASLLKLPALLSPGAQTEWLLLPAALIAGQALVGVLVWVFAGSIARLAAQPQQAMFESDLPAAHWQGLAISVVGLWQAVSGLSDLVYYAMRWRAAADVIGASVYGGVEIPEEIVAGFAAAAVQSLLGLALVVFSGGLASHLRRWREAGLPPAVD